jgi:hypothetical protein
MPIGELGQSSSMRRVPGNRIHAFVNGTRETPLAVTSCQKCAGIQFIDDDAMGGFGLRMAKKKRKR